MKKEAEALRHVHFSYIIIITYIFVLFRNVRYHLEVSESRNQNGFKVTCHGQERDLSQCYMKYTKCQQNASSIGVECAGQVPVCLFRDNLK